MDDLLEPLLYLECLQLISERDKLAPCELHPIMINEIMAVEDELGAALPKQYENFLITVGAGNEYGGLATWYHLDLTRNGNLLQSNEDLHTNKGPEGVPNSFLAVYDPRDGSHIGFQRHNGSFDPEVFIWSAEDGLETLAEDFAAFLRDNIDCGPDEIEEVERRIINHNGNGNGNYPVS